MTATPLWLARRVEISTLPVRSPCWSLQVWKSPEEEGHPRIFAPTSLLPYHGVLSCLTCIIETESPKWLASLLNLTSAACLQGKEPVNLERPEQLLHLHLGYYVRFFFFFFFDLLFLGCGAHVAFVPASYNIEWMRVVFFLELGWVCSKHYWRG